MTKQGETIQQIKAFVRAPYAWPGGYLQYAVTSDGAALCAACCKKELKNIVTAISQSLNTGWNVVGIDINWEEPDLYCDHCSQPIESAYGD